MKISDFWNETAVRPFRFSIVLVAIILAFLITQKSNGQDSDWNQAGLNWTTSFEEAIQQSEERNAPIMIYFHGSDWCPWSQKLASEVFESKEFTAWMDAKLVPVNVDFPRKKTLPNALAEQNNKLLNRYRPHLTGFPTALFVKPDGTVVGKLGYEEGGVRAWTHKAQSIVAKLDKVASLFFNPMNGSMFK